MVEAGKPRSSSKGQKALRKPVGISELNSQTLQLSKQETEKSSLVDMIQTVPKMMFGLNPNVNPGVLVKDENTIIYVCGHNVVIQNLEKGSKSDRGEQEYIPGIEGGLGITAMALSSNKKWLAVCEKGAEQPICSIYELKVGGGFVRRRVLTSKELNSQEFCHVAFANGTEKHNNYLLTITNKPDRRLIVWLWDRASPYLCEQPVVFDEMSAGIDETPYTASFNPDDPNVLVLTGKDTFKYYRIKEGCMQLIHPQLGKKDLDISKNYTCHCWTTDKRLIVCTVNGEIAVCDPSGELKVILQKSNDRFSIKYIRPRPKSGFLVTDKIGKFQSYELTSNPAQPYTSELRTLPANEDKESPWWEYLKKNQENYPWFEVTGMEFAGENLIYSSVNQQLFKMRFCEEKPEEIGLLSYLTVPFHSKKITAISTCLKKPFLVTGSEDKTIRLYTYSPSQALLQLEHCQMENSPVQSLALHPSGLYLLVAFNDRISYYSVFSDKFEKFKEDIHCNGCTEIKFSHGGHLFACNTTQGEVLVYKFFTSFSPECYKFDTQLDGGKIKAINWYEDDIHFAVSATSPQEYRLILFDLRDNVLYQVVKSEPNIRKTGNDTSCMLNNFFTSVVASREPPEKEKMPSTITCFTASSDQTIREVNINPDPDETRDLAKFPFLIRDLTIKLDESNNYFYSQLLLFNGKRAFFAGTGNNKDDKAPSSYKEEKIPSALHVLSYESYGSPNNFIQLFEVQLHQGSVSKMCSNHEMSVLFSAGIDGSIVFMQVVDKDPRKLGLSVQSIQQSSPILIKKSVRDLRLRETKELRASIAQSKDQVALKTRLFQNEREKIITELTARIAKMEEEHTTKINRLDGEQKRLTHEHQQRMNDIEKNHKSGLDGMKTDNARKILSDNEKFAALMEARDNLKVEFQHKIEQIKAMHMDQLKNVQARYAKEREEWVKQKNLLEEERFKIESLNKSEREGLENRGFQEIDDLVERNKQELTIYIEKGLEAKSNLTKNLQDFKQAKNEKEAFIRDLQEKKNLFQTQLENIQRLNKDKELQQKELCDRDETLEDKKTRIFELKKKIQELEKFKFVLDYKIKELKRDIGPREIAIQKLNEQTNKMRSELRHFNRVNQNLSLIVEDMRMRQEGLTNEVQKMRINLEDQEKEKKRFKDDLYEFFQHSSDFKKMKKGIIRLHKTWVLAESVKDQSNSDLNNQFTLKRAHLENSIKCLRDKLSNDAKNHQKENKRILKENVTLIQEINNLKMQYQRLHIQEMRQIRDEDLGRAKNLSQQTFISRKKRAQSAAPLAAGRRFAAVKKECGDLSSQIQEAEERLRTIQLQNHDMKMMIAERNEQEAVQNRPQTDLREPGSMQNEFNADMPSSEILMQEPQKLDFIAQDNDQEMPLELTQKELQEESEAQLDDRPLETPSDRPLDLSPDRLEEENEQIQEDEEANELN